MSIGALLSAHLIILRIKVSARTNTVAPPDNYNRAGAKHPKIILPYSSVVTAIACTSYILTHLLCNPSNLAWHLMLLNAALALQILFSNIVHGLLFSLLIINPRYLNSFTFSIDFYPHLNSTSIYIYIALVFFTFIIRPFISQKHLNAFNKFCRPSALWETRIASSAKASKKIYKVAFSNKYRLLGTILFSSKYYNKYG